MHKLIEYVCDELEELERKADKGKLSMTEMQYVDLLAHTKKNLLTADAMMEADDEYSNDGGSSYARGRGRYAKRDAMGRYSYDDVHMMGGTYRDGRDGRDGRYSRADAKEDMLMELHNMEKMAQDNETRQMVKRWIKQVEEQ